MKIRGILVSGAVTFLALLAIILGLTVKLLTSGGSDTQYVNLAGRQRMLSQKLSKEVLTYLQKPTAENLAQIDKTTTVFTRTHKALRFGGSAPTKLDNSGALELVAPTDAALLAKLDQVGSHWEELSSAIQKLSVAGGKLGPAVNKLAETSAGILATMDQTVNLYSSRDSGLTINIAGRQRMLSQKLAKEALLYVAEPSLEGKQSLEESMVLFSKSHKGLRFGGETTVGGQTVSIDGAPSSAVSAKLETADRLWKEMEAALKVILGEGVDVTASKAFFELNPKVLAEMDEAVSLAEHIGDEKIKTLQTAQIAAMVVGLVLVVLTITVASQIGASIARLHKAAEEISLGEVSKSVQIQGIAELKDLAAAFERMRVSLAIAVEQLEEQGDEGLGSAVTAKAPPARAHSA